MTTQSGRILVGALDRIVYSSANYWAAMLGDLAAALAFLALGLNRFSGPWVVAGGVVIAGFMSSGLLEYVLHRWVLHGPPSMAKRGHAQHHAEPRALISTPLFVIMTGALAIWGLLGLVLPAGVAALLVFGLYAGYNYFALVHHVQHHRGKDLACVAYLPRLERLHHLHHYRQVVNFGISTTIWDRLFGTFQPTNEPATDDCFWSTIRSYWMKLTCKPSAACVRPAADLEDTAAPIQRVVSRIRVRLQHAPKRGEEHYPSRSWVAVASVPIGCPSSAGRSAARSGTSKTQRATLMIRRRRRISRVGVVQQ